MAPEDLDFPAGRTVELHFPDITADLHAVSPGIHAQSSSDCAGDTDESFHAAEVIFRAEGNYAAKVRCSIDVRKVAIEHHAGLGTNELQDYPGQLPVADEQV